MFEGKVIGHVQMKYNGVVVAESIQWTTPEVDAEMLRVMAMLEEHVKGLS